MTKSKASVIVAAVSMLALTVSAISWKATSAEGEPVVKIMRAEGADISLDEMFEKSSGVVVARLSNVHVKYAPSRFEPGGQDVMTYATADIEESIKVLEGNPESIEVRTIGGEIGKVRQEVIGGAALRNGERVLLFLEGKFDGAYEIAGWKLGFYPLNERSELGVVVGNDSGRRVIGLPEGVKLEMVKQKYEEKKGLK